MECVLALTPPKHYQFYLKNYQSNQFDDQFLIFFRLKQLLQMQWKQQVSKNINCWQLQEVDYIEL